MFETFSAFYKLIETYHLFFKGDYVFFITLTVPIDPCEALLARTSARTGQYKDTDKYLL